MHTSQIQPAVDAAVSTASALDLRVDDAVVLHDSNRLALRLRPCDVLARVAAPVRRNHEVAAFEVEMARRLEEADCPIAVLDPRVDPLVHVRDGFAITFWKYYEPLPAADTTLAEYAQTLERLHAGMRQLDAPAPHFTERVEEAQSIVRDRSQSPELIDTDRELLTNSLGSLRRAVVDRGADEQLLHGEPHAGNLLRTTSGMRFIDLETCCRGPVEFDLAHVPEEVSERYTTADQDLVRECRGLVLAMVAAWRWDPDDQLPNGQRAARELLSALREGPPWPPLDVVWRRFV